MPIPFNIHFIQAATEQSRPMLIPEVLLENGKSIMPIAYMKEINLVEEGDKVIVSWRQEVLCDLEDDEIPTIYKGGSSETLYTFEEDCITCTYKIKMTDSAIKEVHMCFEAFDEETTQAVEVEGLTWEARREVGEDSAYQTPYGQLRYTTTWKQIGEGQKEIIVSWKLKP